MILPISWELPFYLFIGLFLTPHPPTLFWQKENAEDLVGAPLFKGKPDCAMFGKPQPTIYASTPRGGSNCVGTQDGWVYSWSSTDFSPPAYQTPISKIGCTTEPVC